MAAPTVIRHKTAFMQRILDYVQHGYRHWTSGEIAADKAQRLAKKFILHYQVDLDRNRRARAKAAGLGVAVLLFYESSPGVLMWILLVTKGDHPAHKLEKLQDANETTSFPAVTGYELVRLTRQGSSKPVYTWRMKHDTYADWRQRIVQTVRQGNPVTVKQTMQSLLGVPGFSGSRTQVKKLHELFRAEWKRHRSTAIPEDLPKKVPYVRRVKSVTVPLSVWVKASSTPPNPNA